MDIQKVGDDFTTSIKLDLVPHLTLPRGWLILEYEYTTTTCARGHATISGLNGTDPSVLEFGRDVYSIRFMIYCHNSFPTTPLLGIHSPEITIGELILLNLACKLLP